jgi:phage tail tape-measure protein
MQSQKQPSKGDANRDPITGEPGAHPVGVGVGTAAGGAAAGALAGAVGGPIGAAAGAIVGGVAGALAGKATAESIDPTREDAYWRENYPKQSYYADDVDYETVAPAYRYGWESQSRYADQAFDDVESDLRKEWEVTEHNRSLKWDQARPASRDAWQRVRPQKG